jgi:hypothetical protein
MLDTTESTALDYYLVLTGPPSPTCDTLAGPDGVQSVDLGIYASWWTNLRTNKS